MKPSELMGIIAKDEDSKHQFKENVNNETSLVQEMIVVSMLWCKHAVNMARQNLCYVMKIQVSRQSFWRDRQKTLLQKVRRKS